MIRINSEQLKLQLQKQLHSCYMLFGNNVFLIQESQKYIYTHAKTLQFNELINLSLDDIADKLFIFNIFKQTSLFSYKKILLIRMPESEINVFLNERLLIMASMINKNILLILFGKKLIKSFKNSNWFKLLTRNSVLVNCDTPEYPQLFFWLNTYAKNMNLTIDDVTCKLLCQYYEGNIQELIQKLNELSLIYPDGNIYLSRVKKIINNAAYFTPFNWIDSVLSGDSIRASYILQQLKFSINDPIILLRTMQHDIIILLFIKRQIKNTPIKELFSEYKIWQKRQILFLKALQRLHLQQLHQAIILMIKIELSIKQNINNYVWLNLDALTLLLCGEHLPEVIFYD